MGEKTVMLHARVSEQEHAAIQKKAESLGMSISALIRLLGKAEVQIIIKAEKEDE